MKRIPMDTSRTYLCVGEPTPVLDWVTKAPKVGPTGLPEFQVPVLALTEGLPEVLGVKVPGEPKGLMTGAPVRISELVAIPYTTEAGESRFAYRANSIEPARAERAGS